MSTQGEISAKSPADLPSEEKFMAILNKINGVVQVLEKQSVLLKEQNATISRFHTKLEVLESAISGLRTENAMLKNEIRLTTAKMEKTLARTDSTTVEEELNVSNFPTNVVITKK